jgi:hypothetical protein
VDRLLEVASRHERLFRPQRGMSTFPRVPYFSVTDRPTALEQVVERGGSIHPGDRWAICRDSEGSPIGLANATTGEALPAARLPGRCPTTTLKDHRAQPLASSHVAFWWECDTAMSRVRPCAISFCERD